MSGPSLGDALALIRAQLFFHIPPITTSFAGQTVVVTGGNAGLGRELVKQLLEHNVDKVILACRTISKGETAKNDLLAKTGSRAVIEVWQVDMANFTSVKAFAECLKALPRLDAAVLNAGSWPNGQSSAEGYETTLTVNVIGTFLLARLLLPKLQATSDQYKTTARVCLLSSGLHKFATLKARKDIKHSDLLVAIAEQQLKKQADYDARYNDSKLLLNMYGVRLSQQYRESHGKDVSFVFVNPGYCASALKPPRSFSDKMGERIMARSNEEGGRYILDAIDESKAAGRNGKYITEARSTPTRAG